MQQAFKYKAHLFELHISTLGFANILNPNFYKTIQCFVYLQTSQKAQLDQLYNKPINEVKKLLNSEDSKKYYSKKYQLERDKYNTFAQDSIDGLIKKIKSITRISTF